MYLHPLSVFFLVLVVAVASEVCVAVTTSLHGFRGCAVREFSFKPILDPPYIHRHHRVCTYNRTRQMTARLPGCQPNVSPLYHYPMALHCHCAICSMQDAECETF
ncbi:hypothetical protein JOQ06_019857 [Pogonophryne albipinna]|uniref:Glycoprotein hormone subunit beta domain-containing protein n=1 Tax=Pogonophryne albipinna TaxID=1090488 RepID=A0AAD6FV17_9TELE|nr:hypothetical protein JOQ06_019857 [Pogonophryne albipinna]